MEEEVHDEEEVQDNPATEPEETSGTFYAAAADEGDEEEGGDYAYSPEVDNTPITVRVFMHTGATLVKQLPRGSTVVDLRKALEQQDGRLTYGSSVILQGVGVTAEDEENKFLSEGDIVTFTGAVKGGSN